MFRTPFTPRPLAAAVALLGAGLATPAAHAQTTAPEPAKLETSHGFELRGGYTSGRFSHSTADTHSSFNLFGGGGNPRPGFPVEHRYDGLLLGADFVQTQHRTGRPSTLVFRAGLDVLGATDRLRISNGRRATVGLLAAHPHFSLELQRRRWTTRAGAGLLAGRVGYYGQEGSFDLLSTNIVVDTVNVVPTFQFETGWNHWLQIETGYGANGLLGLANPAYYAGVGTGFGPRSPLTLVVGATSAASLNYERTLSSLWYGRLALAPAGRPWQASLFATLGTAQYQRVALQVGYKLPGKAGSAGQ